MKVKVYSTPTCPYCHKEKAWLKEKGIEFDDINVAEDQKAAAEMIEKSGGTAVPVTIIDDKEVIVGFDKDKLKEKLNIKE